jgi:hypothetical protein
VSSLSSKKKNENKSTSSKVKFVHSFFGRNVGLKKSFGICLTFRICTFELMKFSLTALTAQMDQNYKSVLWLWQHESFRGCSVIYTVPNWNTLGIMVITQFHHIMAVFTEENKCKIKRLL